MAVDHRIVEEANRRYQEYLVQSGRRDVPGQKQVFLDGYITGMRYGFEFGEFISKTRRKKKILKQGETYGKKNKRQ